MNPSPPVQIRYRSSVQSLCLLLSPLLLAACASTPIHTRQLAAAESAVRSADTASTREDAGTELRVATDKLTRAQQAAQARDSERALRLAEQAELDAQVAVLTARSVRTSRSAQEAESAARALREELERGAAGRAIPSPASPQPRWR